MRIITAEILLLGVALTTGPAQGSDPFSLDALLDDTASPELNREPSALWPVRSTIDPSDKTVTIDWADEPDETLPFAAILQIEHARAWDDAPEELFILFSDGRRVLLERGEGVSKKVALMKAWLATRIVEMQAGEGHASPPDSTTRPPTLSITAGGGTLSLGRLRAPVTNSTAPSTSAATACTDCISKRDVDLVVKTRMDKIRECYQRELRSNSGLAGHMIVKFVVGRDGGTASAMVKESGIENKAVEQCVLQQFLLMRFPRPQGNQQITATYPLMFASG